MTNFAGYWVGRFGGTSMGGFTMVIHQQGAQITGSGEFNEPAVGHYEYLMTGEAQGNESLALALTPKNAGALFQLGELKATCTLKRDGALVGKWQSSNGRIGTFTAQRQPEPVDETSIPVFIRVRGYSPHG